MYCINCGVKLADSEKKCPLCGVAVFHPDLIQPEGEPMYPNNVQPVPQRPSRAAQIVMTTMMLMAGLISLACDLQISGKVTWSGYVIGALLVGYSMMVLPFWFSRPNPVIFVPCSFAVVGAFLLYINLKTGGDWFLGLALPVTAVLGVIVTGVIALLRYVRRGQLYIFGGAFLALGLFMPVLEYLIYRTFSLESFFGWSFYPLIALVLFGGMLIFLAICRPARERMEQNFFI